MIKKELPGETLKERLLAARKDRLYHFWLADKSIRGVMIHGTRMIQEMRVNHDMGILESLVLGHAYLGVGLMSATLKGNDRLSIQIDCDGPVGGLSAEASAYGEIRGYLKNPVIPLEKPLENFDLSPFFGAGFLTVTRHLEDAKQPFSSKTALKYGNIAQDLTYYHATSEQIPTAIHLSIQFSPTGNITGAGGLLVQAMPDAQADMVATVEKVVENLSSLGKLFAENVSPETLLQGEFSKFSPQIITNRRIEFMCHCHSDRVKQVLRLLPKNERENLMVHGPFPVDLRCHYCNTVYKFSKSDIEKIHSEPNSPSQ
ncbi:MAG: Hsp33 family molecular chaperone HslO [Deltaproteobacteria bacterium]|nr:Hsp33 family molecular chaperone HslO [Deltaproteobacteria bacterium]